MVEIKSRLFCRQCGTQVTVKEIHGFLKYECPTCQRTVVPEERGVEVEDE